MGLRIKIDGIYDQRTIANLNHFSVADLGFDFRPKSFNFLQEYKFLELVDKNFNADFRYFLRYENEKNFMISKVLDDLRSILSKRLSSINENFFLEFSDKEAPQFYDQFDMPFYYHFVPEASFKNVLSCKNLKGIVIDYSFLHQRHEDGSLYPFIQNFHQLTTHASTEKKLELMISLDWDSDVFPSLFDLFDVDLVSFPINTKIEVCYRNVDLNKINQGIRHFQRISI